MVEQFADLGVPKEFIEKFTSETMEALKLRLDSGQIELKETLKERAAITPCSDKDLQELAKIRDELILLLLGDYHNWGDVILNRNVTGEIEEDLARVFLAFREILDVCDDRLFKPDGHLRPDQVVKNIEGFLICFDIRRVTPSEFKMFNQLNGYFKSTNISLVSYIRLKHKDIGADLFYKAAEWACKVHLIIEENAANFEKLNPLNEDIKRIKKEIHVCQKLLEA